MPGENVEIVRAAIDAWSRGDWDTAFENAAPDLEFDNTRNLGEWRAVRTTPAQVRRDWETFTELWESVSIEVEDVIEVGDQVVIRPRSGGGTGSRSRPTCSTCGGSAMG